MPTDERIEAAVRRFEEADLADGTWTRRDASDLRAIHEAVVALREGERRLRELVAAARANEWSWADIGLALGVSRQAARERFSDKVRTMADG